MSVKTLPITLSGLSDREAITDTLFRAIAGFDDDDAAMFDSAWASQDVTFDFNGQITHGLDQIKSAFLGLVGPMDTSHDISNIRINIIDASKAELTCYAHAMHYPPGRGNDPTSPHFLSSSRYYLDLIKEEGSDALWKVTNFAMKIIWTQGDPSTMVKTW